MGRVEGAILEMRVSHSHVLGERGVKLMFNFVMRNGKDEHEDLQELGRQYLALCPLREVPLCFVLRKEGREFLQSSYISLRSTRNTCRVWWDSLVIIH